MQVEMSLNKYKYTIEDAIKPYSQTFRPVPLFIDCLET